MVNRATWGLFVGTRQLVLNSTVWAAAAEGIWVMVLVVLAVGAGSGDAVLQAPCCRPLLPLGP